MGFKMSEIAGSGSRKLTLSRIKTLQISRVSNEPTFSAHKCPTKSYKFSALDTERPQARITSYSIMKYRVGNFRLPPRPLTYRPPILLRDSYFFDVLLLSDKHFNY